MKTVLQAKPLAAALGLAASLIDAKLAKRIPVLEAVHLVAKGDAVAITTNALDFALTVTVPATVEEAGEVAVSASRLSALASAFPADAEIAIGSDDKMATIACGRSRFKLPTLPLADLPSVPAIDQETGRIELEREQLLTLLSRPSFAISKEETRYYLNGLFLHDTADGLGAICTDSHRLARAVLPGASGLSQDRRLIVPGPAIKILLKLLGDKTIEQLTLRRSRTLLEVTAAGLAFVTKLIDAEYPTYERVVPELSDNIATVDRTGLLRALERIDAVAPELKDTTPLAGLRWTADEPVLHVVIPGWADLADDPITAEVAGSGRIAFKISHGLELLDALKGERVRIDASDSRGSPILITDPQDDDFTIVQMPCVWNAEASSQAA